MPDRWPHTGAVLAGGASRRMGRPKHALPLAGGVTMLEAAAAVLGEVCARVVVVGRVPTRLPCLPDLRPGQGPLAGAETLLASGLDEHYLITTCDMPQVTAALLRRLAAAPDAAVLADAASGRPRPLPARVPAGALGIARDLLDRGERSMQVFVRAIGAEVVVPDEPVTLDSINTPQDYARVAEGQDAD